jgi:hypothetical protein
MSRLSGLIITIAIITAVSLAGRAAGAQSRSSPVLDQMIQALGGQAFLDVKEIHINGRFFSFTRGELSGSDIFVDYIKFPDMERTEFGFNKNKSVTINRGTEGWKIEPKEKEAEPIPIKAGEEFLAGFKTSFDYVLRFVVKQPQTTIQNLPSEIIDFKRIDVVELRDAAKNRIRFFIDRETKLPVKMQVRRSDQPNLNEEQYGNWHKFQGVMTPLFLGRYKDGLKVMEIRAETAAYNSGLSDNLFSPPATK